MALKTKKLSSNNSTKEKFPKLYLMICFSFNIIIQNRMYAHGCLSQQDLKYQKLETIKRFIKRLTSI